ncbi:AfsR/SARP family transcriptional regulator [Amycolatopsis samaneae]|uniref:AfsR/SARP family transcriptional regulator n=1 Tax=Amycolatopsis samaneae TaxID=664691 RepID=A0ABW5GPD5_9PSEU
MYEFRILGPLAVDVDARTVVPATPKVRQVLALFLINLNEAMSVDTLIKELWDTKAPRSAVGTAQTYIYQLRQMLNETSGNGTGFITTLSPGYLFRAEQDQVDLFRFRSLVACGQHLLGQGKQAEASETLTTALGLWHGNALANVMVGPVLRPYLVNLEEERLRALELRIEIDMDRGLHRKLVGELKSLTSQYPYNEWLHARLIEALARSGRRKEALETFRSLYSLLADELGVAPSTDVQRLQQQILVEGLPEAALSKR